MGLAELPLFLALLGLAAYVVLGGADFGAGVWYMLLPGEHRRPLRDHSYHAMGPVWEANHVWLIFVLVVVWTAYPTAFGAIFSTLYVPLFVAALGIILRGTCYALRGVVSGPREERILGGLFGVSSALTPFALGAAIGGIASGRVPVGNSVGDPIASWLNPTSILVGVLAIVTSAYLAAVWLTADAARAGQDDVAQAFRRRAIASGGVAGAVALGGLLVLRSDAERIYHGLTSGAGLVAVLASVAAGAATLLFVVRRRLEAARWSAAVAVGTIVAGWALAQRPQLLPGLTVDQAAAGDATLITLLVSLAIGAVILIPSLVLLFGMVVRGRFDEGPDELGSLEHAVHVPDASGQPAAEPERRVAVAAGVCAAVGVPLTIISDGGAPLALGVVLLLAAIASGAAFVVPKVALAGNGNGNATRRS
jgi:cytochrome bd ubiquinol oxidase subunit II